MVLHELVHFRLRLCELHLLLILQRVVILDLRVVLLRGAVDVSAVIVHAVAVGRDERLLWTKLMMEGVLLLHGEGLLLQRVRAELRTRSAHSSPIALVLLSVVGLLL